MPSSITVKQTRWGISNTGERIHRFTLTAANGAEVTVSDLGASLLQWLAPDRHGALANIVLGFDTPQDYLESSTHMGGIIGRWANRIADARFVLDGKTYLLEANDGPNSLHGGVHGFDRSVWRAQIIEDGVRFSHLSTDGDAGFPGELEVSVTYRFDPSGALRLDYTGRTNAPTPLNLTCHAYFNLTATGTALDHVVSVAADAVLLTDAGGIPSAAMDVTGTAFDFRTGAAVRSRLETNEPAIRAARGIDHYFVSNRHGLDPLDLQMIAKAFDPTSGRELTVLTTAPGVQFYTASNLEGVMGKAGVHHLSYDALCFETGVQPNQVSHADPTLAEAALLRPDHVYRHSTIFQVTVPSEKT